MVRQMAHNRALFEQVPVVGEVLPHTEGAELADRDRRHLVDPQVEFVLDQRGADAA